MRIRRGLAAAGITVAAVGGSFAAAGVAAAVTVTNPVAGTITGPHTFTFPAKPAQVVLVGERLHPNAPGYGTSVPVVGISVNAKTGVTTVTTGNTFLPLNRIGVTTTFTVLPPLP